MALEERRTIIVDNDKDGDKKDGFRDAVAKIEVFRDRFGGVSFQIRTRDPGVDYPGSGPLSLADVIELEAGLAAAKVAAAELGATE